MKRIFVLGIILLSICISLAAVSAADDDGFSFNFFSSESTNSDGGDVSIENDQLSIQGFDFTIPEGFVENESAQRVAEDGKDGFEGFKISNVEFNKGEEFIVIKVVFGDVDIDEESYTPADDTVPKEVAGVNGWFTEYNDSVSFDYIADGKIVEIFAPNEEMLADLIESSQA